MTLWTTLKAQLDATGVDGALTRAARHIILHGPTTYEMGRRVDVKVAAEAKAQVDVLYAIRTYLISHAPMLDEHFGDAYARVEAFRREHATCPDEVCAAWRQARQPDEGLNL